MLPWFSVAMISENDVLEFLLWNVLSEKWEVPSTSSFVQSDYCDGKHDVGMKCHIKNKLNMIRNL